MLSFQLSKTNLHMCLKMLRKWRQSYHLDERKASSLKLPACDMRFEHLYSLVRTCKFDPNFM